MARLSYKEYDEESLAEGCRQLRDTARKELYERYGGRMLALCLRYAGNRETAEDWMHDGFLKIFRSFDGFQWRGNGSLEAWMTRVMVNMCLQNLREDHLMGRMVELDDVPQVYDEPDPEQVERIPSQLLMQFIAELPVGYRTVFNLFVIEGKSHKEIASLLGINERSSSSQLARAKALLARRIRQWMEENI